MKSIITILALSFLCCGLSYAEDIKLPHITVFGTAIKKVTPDRMNWYLSVKNKGGDLQEVAELHSKYVELVLAFLKKMKIPTEELQTARMEFGENWEYRFSSRVKNGYFASTDIFFKLHDFEKYKSLWMGISQIEYVTVNSVSYDHSKRIEFQNETRKKALLAAKEKAIALAETLGSQIGEPLLIEEDTSMQDYPSIRTFGNSISMDEDDLIKGEGIAPGMIPIKMRMKTVFRLITPDK